MTGGVPSFAHVRCSGHPAPPHAATTRPAAPSHAPDGGPSVGAVREIVCQERLPHWGQRVSQCAVPAAARTGLPSPPNRPSTRPISVDRPDSHPHPLHFRGNPIPSTHPLFHKSIASTPAPSRPRPLLKRQSPALPTRTSNNSTTRTHSLFKSFEHLPHFQAENTQNQVRKGFYLSCAPAPSAHMLTWSSGHLVIYSSLSPSSNLKSQISNLCLPSQPRPRPHTSNNTYNNLTTRCAHISKHLRTLPVS